MRFQRVLCAVALTGLVAGCTSTAPDEPKFTQPSVAASAPPWTEPDAYSYVLTRGCDAAKPAGRYRAKVRAGQVAGATRIGTPDAPNPSADVDLGPVTGEQGEEIDVPTLAGLLEMARTTADDGGQVTTEFDVKDGHPVRVTLNTTGAADGAECWSVSDYRIG
ncbi:hypothetical protein ACWT_1782 [Actinoplanes sp. SE50]|uniref:hypothetical protein n=1 Tax=unclassified Actinoplanes TaxID=2626549 RepID=UPI00023ED3CE|nr:MULTISPECIES: hypothetical protein [unclassified Actinoplanes]AEV82801.1 hypothetical protein ACPL_1904 [Actinoplanes sp. SE50/110]ATO81197.1 hypothetical protein ACWT_1782 [Actinoplanes sp. SE50]SLL98604.1 hypothetical protein ACSP50_1831 [Actinoplanes sp. SE50/110]